MIYLDYCAGVPLRPCAKDIFIKLLESEGNASSPHYIGRQLRSYIDETRKVLSAFTGAQKIIFVSGGTEANTLALKGLGKVSLIVSGIEHESVLHHAAEFKKIPVTEEGMISLDALEKLLATHDTPGLVSLMLVNNETGVIQPVKEAARLAHARGWKVHTDACQAVGFMPLSMEELGVDMMTLSSPKSCGGPVGTGALLLREDIQLQPIIIGGGQEFGMRSGTQSAPLIAAFGAAFKDTVEKAPSEKQRLTKLQEMLEISLPDAIIYGKGNPRVPSVSCLGMPGVAADLQLMAFDLAGLAVSAGAACSSGKMKKSHVLTAMGLPDGQAKCAIRVSYGWKTEEADIQKFIETWQHIYARQK